MPVSEDTKMVKKQVQISYSLVVLFKGYLFLMQDLKDKISIFLAVHVSMKIYQRGTVGQETIENYYIVVGKGASRKPGGHHQGAESHSLIS